MSNKEELGIELPPEPNGWMFALMSAPAIGALRLSELISDYSPRNILPEPFDVFDHIGNPAAMTAGAFMFGLGRAMFREEKIVTEAQYRRSNRTYAAAAALLTITANGYGELVGYGDFSTGDPVDFVYGALAGFCAYKAFKTSYTSETQMNQELASADDITYETDPGTFIRHRRFERLKEKIAKLKENQKDT